MHLFYFTDSKANLHKVLAEGILPEAQDEDEAWSNTLYGGQPIYLDAECGKIADGYVVRADVTGLSVLPDVSILGSMCSEIKNEGLYWANKDLYFVSDKAFKNALRSRVGLIKYDELFNNDVIKKSAISCSGRAAVIVDKITPDRLIAQIVPRASSTKNRFNCR